MPIDHFHPINSHVEANGIEGLDLPSLDVARAKAIDGIRDYLGHELSKARLDLPGRIDIEDDSEAVLATIPLNQAVSIETW